MIPCFFAGSHLVELEVAQGPGWDAELGARSAARSGRVSASRAVARRVRSLMAWGRSGEWIRRNERHLASRESGAA